MKDFTKTIKNSTTYNATKPITPNPLASNSSLKKIISPENSYSGNGHENSALSVKQEDAGRLPTGRPLDKRDCHEMSKQFGYDFSDVRIHTHSAATRSADSHKAMAYTRGNNIVFGSGQYAPSTNRGRSLIAHELAHVVQQHRRGGPTSIESAESEADHAAEKIQLGNNVDIRSSSQPGIAQFKRSGSSRPDKTDEVRLYERPGRILSAMVVKNGVEYGYGYVQYPPSMTAQQARAQIGIGKIYDSDGYLVAVDLLLPQELTLT